jgi:hypothetical protein
MIGRCYNENATGFEYYGGRGVRVCDRWLGKDGFLNFVEDLGMRPKGTTLDKDLKGGVGCKLYSPENCCWATPLSQSRSTRSVKLSEVKAEEIRQSLSLGILHKDLAQRYGIDQGQISRIRNNKAWRTNHD